MKIAVERVTEQRYARVVTTDPLKSALEEISPNLDASLQPLVDSLIAGESGEDAWADLVQGVLDEA